MIYVIQIILSFLISYFFILKYIDLAKLKGIIGRDVHKIDEPKIAEMGGYGLIFGFIFGISFAIPFIEYHLIVLIFASFLSIILASFIGTFDDLFNLSLIKKLILIFLASIPLIVIRAGNTQLTFPIFGQFELGILYSLFFVPIFFATFSNMTNMLEGYNGLATGLGIITLISYIIIHIAKNIPLGLYILLPFTASLIALYLFNRYPARVFPGDTANLAIGACIASVAIITGTELIAILLCILYLFNFSLYFLYLIFLKRKYKESTISRVDEKGYLIRQYFDEDKTKIQWHKLYFLFEHIFYPLTEKGMLKLMFLVQIIINIAVVLLFV